MKKITEEIKNMSLNTDMEYSLKDEYIKSLKDSDFKELVSNLSMVEEDLMKYTSKLQETSVEHAYCRDCKGITECKNNITGFAFTPYVDGKKLVFSYDICRYNKKIREANKYQDNVFYFDVPKEIKEAKMSEIYTNDMNRVTVLKWIKDFYRDYKKTKRGKGLYLHGNFGSGKTYLLAALFNELAKQNFKVAIIYWPEFLRTLKASFDTDFDEKYQYIKKIPLLLIDDLGAENLTPWARDEILGPILQFRMQEELSTFFTSNLNLEDLEKHFSTTNMGIEKVKAKRIIERIKQLSIEVDLISKNNRK